MHIYMCIPSYVEMSRYSCATETHAFFVRRARCRSVQQEHLNFDLQRMHGFLMNQITYVLVFCVLQQWTWIFVYIYIYIYIYIMNGPSRVHYKTSFVMLRPPFVSDLYMCTCVHRFVSFFIIYIYTYIQRESERETNGGR